MFRTIPTICVFVAATSGAAQASRVAVLPVQLEPSAQGQVPALIDDYVLTAVQKLGGYEVVGPDDINAMLGFEKQKALVGCDDVSCMADIAGALGVDRLVVLKVARVGADWATTSKLMNVRTVRVESRVTDFVSGDAKALLEGIPGIVRNLFGAAPPTESSLDQAPAAVELPAPALATPATEPAPVPVYKNAWFWGVVGGATLIAIVVAAKARRTDATPAPEPLNGSGGLALISWK